MGTNDEKIIRTWVLVADSAEARLFLSYPGQQGWFELRSFHHPKSRAKGMDLVTSMPAMESGTLPKEQEAGVFAHELAEYLDLNFSRNNFERLILVAPPEFLGLMRGELTKQVEACLADTMNKDLVSLPKEQLEERIEPHH